MKKKFVIYDLANNLYLSRFNVPQFTSNIMEAYLFDEECHAEGRLENDTYTFGNKCGIYCIDKIYVQQ